MAASIPALREAIDDIDRRILELVSERLRLVLAVGEIKRELALPVYDATRERELLDRVGNAAARPLSPEMAQRIFACIIQESRTLEQQHLDQSSSKR